MISNRAVLGSALLIPALLLSNACSRTKDDGTRGRTRETTSVPVTKHEEFAFVRFIDAHNGKASLHFGDTLAFTGSGEGVTDYKQLPAERREFSLRAPGGETLATNSESLSEGKHYTVIAFNDKNKPALRVVTDDESAPDQGKAKVRIIHAAPDMEALNLYAAGHKDKLASESRFTTVSTWQEVDPVKGPLELRTSGGRSATVRVPGLTLEPGRLYTFVVSGGDNVKQSLHVTPIVDSPTKS